MPLHPRRLEYLDMKTKIVSASLAFALFSVALILFASPDHVVVVEAGPGFTAACFGACFAACASMGAAAFAGLVVASGGAAAAGIPTGASATIAGCSQLCGPVCAIGLWFPSP